LTKILDNGEPKSPAPPMKKIRRSTPKKLPPVWKQHICNGCGYEYIPNIGDIENGVTSGTLFENLPDAWICPECGEEKDQFIEV
jgi:rubredoxin